MVRDGPILDRLILLGIRHHSPACALRVRRAIETVRPAFVLIEGPCDFNPHIGDLDLAHHLPIAIFSFHADTGETRASYAPFCSYSPEWQALRAARDIGATPLFCDLPAWDPAFGQRENRYADPHRLLARYRAATVALADRIGAEGQDAMWDALVEQADEEAVPRILDQYFALLRPDGFEDPSEVARETHMGRYAAWALREAAGRPVILVCGGWHIGGVRKAAQAADGTPPALPEAGVEARTGSYLLPYSYGRLDRFTGYSAGMPSPGYYEHVHAEGLDAAAEWAMACVTQTLRQAGQVVSTADRIAWRIHAEALARLRGHAAILRTDLLDAALATLVKEGLDVPAAWTQAGAIARGNDPFVVAMLKALSGEREGRLAPGTRRPPLIGDVEQRLQELDLVPTRALRKVWIDWHDSTTRERAHVLHQLRILAIPGFARTRGPAQADDRDLTEAFEVEAHRQQAGSLIEASRWGGTLPMAAAACLSEKVLAHPGDLDVVAGCLSSALFAGLLGLGRDLVGQLLTSIPASHDIAALGRAGRQIARLYRFGDLFGPFAHADLGRMAETFFARALWLIEGIRNDEEGRHAIAAVLACRDLARECDELALDRNGATAVLLRCLSDDATPPGLAGAALGYLVACREESVKSTAVAARIRRFGRPERLGDFLAGVFALAREELDEDLSTLATIDELVAGWSHEDYLRALPAMRMALAWFPPNERERLARAILQRHGISAVRADIEVLAWMRQRTAVADQVAALSLETRVAARLARYGLS